LVFLSDPSGESVPENTPILRNLTPADLVSITNAALGLLAVFLISLGHLRAALVCIMLAVIGDGLDGELARRGHGGGIYGTKLDSFADFIAFAIAPAALLVTTYYPGMPGELAPLMSLVPAALVAVVAGLFVICGMLRLSRFEVVQARRRQHYFIGLSVPGAGLLVGLVALLGVPELVALVLTLSAALLMVSRLRFPKIQGMLAPAAVLVLLATILFGHRFHSIELLLLSMLGVYILLGPLVVWRRDRREAEWEATWEA
jgi:archaetidylserine synthase